MTEIGFTIQLGESIPDDVTWVEDRVRDKQQRDDEGLWHQGGIGNDGCPWSDEELLRFAPLTVTAVREPERKVERAGWPEEAAYWTDDADGDPVIPAVREQPTAEPDEELVHYRLPGATLTFCGLDPWDDEVSITERAGSSNCRACRLTADEAEKPAAEPPQADASTVLDLLVRQFGRAQYTAGYQVASLDSSKAESALTEMRELFERIAALVPQQARDDDGLLLWINSTGEVASGDEPNSDGPWRPLLVGGDPAPEPGENEGTGLRWVRTPRGHWHCGADEIEWCSSNAGCHEDAAWKMTSRERVLVGCLSSHGAHACPVHTLADHHIAQVMAELGVDRPEDVLAMIGELQRAIERACNERDEARAEATDDAARLKLTDRSWAEVARERDEARAELQQHLALRDEAHAELRHHLDSVDRLAGERNEARAEVERCQRLLKTQASNFSAAYNKLAEATPAQSDPLVLSLPTVPEGATLVGEATGQRYSPVRVPNIVMTCWQGDLSDCPMDLGSVLDREGRVRVEAAPPREPRTWPKLADPPEDFPSLLGASGTVYQHSHDDEGVPVYQYVDDITGEKGRTYSFYALQYLDGPLTEAFDEPGGAR